MRYLAPQTTTTNTNSKQTCKLAGRLNIKLVDIGYEIGVATVDLSDFTKQEDEEVF